MHQNYCGASPGYPWDLILRLGSVTTPSQADETGDPSREPLAVAKRRITPSCTGLVKPLQS